MKHGVAGPYAVICRNSEARSAPMRVFLSDEEYNRQMDRPDSV